MHVDNFRSYLAGALHYANDFNENINTKSNEFRTLLENLTQQRVNVKRVIKIYKQFLKKVEGERVKPTEVSLLEFAGYRIPVFNPFKKLIEPAVILGYTGSRSGSLMTTVLPIKKLKYSLVLGQY